MPDKKADILLIQPPVRDFYLTRKRTIPYGLACIAAALIQEGFSVDIADSLATSKSYKIDPLPEMAYLEPFYGRPDRSPFALFHGFKHFGLSFESIGKIAQESGAFLIGISSLFTAYNSEALTCAQIVKQYHPTCKIVLGGHHPTVLPESVMACESVDFVIRGEGECAMPVLAKTLKYGGDLNSVPGIVFRNNDGTLNINSPAMMKDLESYPLPALHLIDNKFYKRGKGGSSVITASRGCPMSCAYCCVGRNGMIKYRRRSVESVMKEIETAVIKYGSRFIDFEDENLSLEKQWFIQLLTEIKKQFSGIEIRAMNGLLPSSIDETVIRMMKEAGFKTLNLSLGSLSKEQLQRFGRPDIRDSAEQAIDLSRKYGLETVCYIIAGAPYQQAQDSLSDLIWLFKKRVLAGVSIYYPAPGSKDYETYADIFPDKPALMRSSTFPISHTTSRLEAVTLLRLARILNFIKSLIDSGESIPDPMPIQATIKLNDRKEIGKKLLQAFLYDGKIRGITPEGEVYEHLISTVLTHKLELKAVT